MLTGQTAGWNPPWARRLHWPAFAAFCGSILLDLGATLANWGTPLAAGRLHCLPWLMAALSLGVGLARHLPGQNILFAATGSLLFSVGCGLLLAPPGNAVGNRAWAWQMAGQSLAWQTLAVASLGTVRRFMGPFRTAAHYGYGVLAFTWVLMVSLVVRVGGVSGLQSGSGRGAVFPDGGFGLDREGAKVAIVALAALANLVFMIPLLQSKRPARPMTDPHPFHILLVSMAWLEIGRRMAP